jgi:hypothetical protein
LYDGKRQFASSFYFCQLKLYSKKYFDYGIRLPGICLKKA